MATATASISVRGSGQVTIHVSEGETVDYLLSLSDSQLSERIIDWADILDNCIEDDDVEFDDITMDKD